jgi:hypothetical protein
MGTYYQTALASIVGDEDRFGLMNTFICTNRLAVRRSKSGERQIRSGAGIASPCGNWVGMDWPPLLMRFEQGSCLWAITGTTKDSAGAALGSCRVIAMETGRMIMDPKGLNESHVGEVVSDGSGNYTLPVPTNTAYQLTAYKPGSPDVAGITKNNVTPTQVG